MDCLVPTENIRALIIRKNVQKTPTPEKLKRKNYSNRSAGNWERQNQQKIPSDNKRCVLPKQKSPTPKVKDLIEKCVNRPKNEKNYVKENIHSVKNMTCKEKPHIMQDSCDGHCQDLNRAGLELKYVFKKEYGKTPPYIKRNRHLIEKMKKLQQDVNKNVPEHSMRYVDDGEKEAVLNGLRSNLKEAERQFLSLPIITDTLSKRNRKIYLENLLQKLQQDIATLERHDIIIIND